MKKLLFILFVLSSLNGFGQIVRTLNNVSNTADSLRPISKFEQTALNAKQNSLSGTGLARVTGAVVSYDNSAYLTSITTGNVTTALGFTPYNATNPSGFISLVPAQTFSSLTLKPTTLSGYGITDSYPLTGNPSAFITGISSANVTTALGFTPYNATNPSAYIALTGLSSSATGLTYTNTTGALSLTAGYVIPTSTQLATYLLSTTASTTYSPIASPVHTGDIETTTISSGLIVKSPNGTRFRLSVSNTGDIIATSL